MKKDVPSIIFTAVIVLIIGAAIFLARDYPSGARLYPWVIGITVVILGLALLVTDIRGLVKGKPIETRGTGPSMDLVGSHDMTSLATYKKFAVTFGWIPGLYLGIWLFGFQIAVTAYFMTYLFVKGRVRWFMVLALTAGLLVFLFYFERLLSVYWVPGLLDLPFIF